MTEIRKVTNAVTGQQELHPIEVCAECGRDIDNALEGFYGHEAIPGLVLCQEDYQKKVAAAQFEPTRVKLRGRWRIAG